MSTQVLRKLAVTGLVLSYPLLAHWALLLRPDLPRSALLFLPTLLNLLLAGMFGSTLRAGQTPLISVFAKIERQQILKLNEADLPAEIAAYTRKLTLIWTILFIAMAVVASLLALNGETAWWVIFTSVISYVLVSLLFIGEYFFRLHRFPDDTHANPLKLAWLLIKSGPVWMRRQR
ncbi:hypothetical protein D3C72_113530 [compost metagenome]